MVRELFFIKTTIKLFAVAGMLAFIAACNSTAEVNTGATSVVITPPTDPNTVVCDPFQTGDTALLGHGLAANIYYLTDDQPRYTDVNDYINNGHTVDVTMYFNNLNVPTRPFDRGFYTASGQLITNADGNTLYEYFGFHMEGGITLGDGDPEGDYQLALLSDDGSIWQVNDSGEAYRAVVNDNGTHPTDMGCATTPVHMTAGSVIPMKLDYYQGPRYHIALMALWRPWDPNNYNDPLCGQMGNSLYFDSTQDPPTPQQAFLDLQSRGWKVLGPQNFMLPEATGGVNPCVAASAPVISNFRVDSVTQTTATILWDTDVPSTTQEFYALFPPNTYTASDLDNTPMTSHSVTLSGLVSDSLYSTYGISSNSAGQTQTAVVEFSTLR